MEWMGVVLHVMKEQEGASVSQSSSVKYVLLLCCCLCILFPCCASCVCAYAVWLFHVMQMITDNT